MSFPELLDTFSLPFVSRALLTVLVLAAGAALVSVLVSFRGLEFLTDGLVHSIFPGLVIGYLLGGSAALFPAALVAALIAVILITLLSQRTKLNNDAAIAMLLTSAFSLGVVLVSRQHGYMAELMSLLFGNLLTVTATQLGNVFAATCCAILAIVLTWRRQLFRAHDKQGFQAAGFNVLTTDLVLGAAIALLLVAGVQALGNLLIIALLIVPAAAARQLTKHLWALPLVTFLLIVFAGFAGISCAVYLSFTHGVNASAGALVVLFLVGSYLLCLLCTALKAQYIRRSREQLK